MPKAHQTTEMQTLLRNIQENAVTINGIIERILERHEESEKSRRVRELNSQLFDQSSYYLRAGGKRMRPYTTVMAGRLFGEATEELYVAGASVELLHNFTLVHDDIMDADKVRRGIKTAHEAFGIPAAINMGDYLHATSYFVASELESPELGRGVVKSLSAAARDISMGQNLDMSFETLTDVDEAEYLRMISLKTAALYKCSASLGGIVGGMQKGSRITADKRQLDALEDYGENLGLAFQIRDDYLGVFGDESKTGKSVGNDIKRGKRTFILIQAKERATTAQRERIWRAVGNLNAPKSELTDALEVIKGLGLDEKCQELAESYASKAISAIGNFNNSEARRSLSLLAEYEIQRDS